MNHFKDDHLFREAFFTPIIKYHILHRCKHSTLLFVKDYIIGIHNVSKNNKPEQVTVFIWYQLEDI